MNNKKRETMFLCRCLVLVSLFLLYPTSSINAQTRVYTSLEWLNDLSQLEGAILNGHPNPFVNGNEDRFYSLVASLRDDIDMLSDKEIIVRFAEIVGTINDGHTRLSIPREHPEIGLEFGHSGTPVSNSPALSFKQFPIAFEQFDDGVFVTAASAQFKSLIGSKLITIDDTSAVDAMAEVQRITFAENSQLEKLMGADRLSMPEVLEALGIIKNSANTVVTLQKTTGEVVQQSLEPMDEGEVQWLSAFEPQNIPIRNKNPEQLFWYQYFEDENIVFAQIDQISDADVKLAQFVTEIIAKAEQHDAKLVIDIRTNFGGSGQLNRTLKLGIVQSSELNQYGRTYMLIGRRTFSAAQSLVNFMDEFSRVIFVGEPTGARPDHYGDSIKTKLENSGLTLRVSSLHWSGFNSNDHREFTSPDLLTPWTSNAYFAGLDPALSAAINSKDSFNSLLLRAYKYNIEEKFARLLIDGITSPDSYGNNLSQIHLSISNELKANGELEQAGLVLQYGLYLHPDNEKLQKAQVELEGN